VRLRDDTTRYRTQPYGVEGERFQYSVFLVLNNRTISTLVAFVVLRLKGLATAPVRGSP